MCVVESIHTYGKFSKFVYFANNFVLQPLSSGRRLIHIWAKSSPSLSLQNAVLKVFRVNAILLVHLITGFTVWPHVYTIGILELDYIYLHILCQTLLLLWFLETFHEMNPNWCFCPLCHLTHWSLGDAAVIFNYYFTHIKDRYLEHSESFCPLLSGECQNCQNTSLMIIQQYWFR